MKIEDFFPGFTTLFRAYRKNESDYIVYEVDGGEPHDYNVIIRAAKFEDQEMVGEPSTMIVSKEWILENLETIVREASC